MREKVIVTCEHGGNEVPISFQSLFSGQREVLDSHRGWDPGALVVAFSIATQLKVPLYFTKISRLLIEANRSIDSPSLFSEFTHHLPASTKELLINTFWNPYRMQVEEAIGGEVEKGNSVLHLSIHSFTPIWKDEVRSVELGILYDPDRQSELTWANNFFEKLAKISSLNIKHNEPYHGKDDGFTTYLRSKFSHESYKGIEIEINQKFVPDNLPMISALLIAALR